MSKKDIDSSPKDKDNNKEEMDDEMIHLDERTGDISIVKSPTEKSKDESSTSSDNEHSEPKRKKYRVNRKFINENTSNNNKGNVQSLQKSKRKLDSDSSIETRSRSKSQKCSKIENRSNNSTISGEGIVTPNNSKTKGKSKQIDNTQKEVLKISPLNDEVMKNSGAILNSDHISHRKVTEKGDDLKIALVEQHQNNGIDKSETVTTPKYLSDISDQDESDSDSEPELEVSFKNRDESDEFTDEMEEQIQDMTKQKTTERGRRTARSSDKKRKRSRSRKSRSRSRESKRPTLDNRKQYHIEEDMARQRLLSKYKEDPILKQIVKDMVAEQLKEARPSKETTPLKFKSPFESTLYTPAIPKQTTNCSPRLIGTEMIRESTMQKDGRFNVEDINRYLTQLRSTVDSSRRQESGHNGSNRASTSDEMQQERARLAADDVILEAERFKAAVQTNQGRFLQEMDKIKQMRYNDSEDDEFFHITCHIDTQIRQKIEKGDFIELEKLLQKSPNLEKPNEKRMQLVNRDGESFFIPTTDKETKIDNIRKWEQAFRIYTTIYCSANPHRSGEILQYAETIHKAASIFSWDNVAKYDYVFRQLMAQKPHRSWAKIYNQMWNTTLNEPIKRFSQDGNVYQRNQNGNNNHNGRKKGLERWLLLEV